MWTRPRHHPAEGKDTSGKSRLATPTFSNVHYTVLLRVAEVNCSDAASSIEAQVACYPLEPTTEVLTFSLAVQRQNRVEKRGLKSEKTNKVESFTISNTTITVFDEATIRNREVLCFTYLDSAAISHHL